MMGLFFSEQTGYTILPKVNKKIFTLCHECTLLLVFVFFSTSQFGVRYFLLFLFVCEIIIVYIMHRERILHNTTYRIIRHSLGRFSGLNFIRGIVRGVAGVAKATPIFRDLYL